MIIPNSWNVIYTVKFDGDAQNLNDEFESREEALAYAQEHLDELPVVSGIEVYADEAGAIIDEEAPEVIFSYIDQELEEVKKEEPSRSDLANRLKKLEDNPFELEVEIENLEEETSEDEVKDEGEELPEDPEEPEVEEEPFVREPGFLDTDFDIEVASQAPDFSPADFLADIADALGIGDKVEIENVDYIPEVEETEVVEDDSPFAEIPDVAEETVDSPAINFDTDFFSDYYIDIAPEVEQAVDSEEPIADEAPIDPIRTDADGIEPPAKNISTYHSCPECEKKVWECKYILDENQVLTDYTQQQMAAGKSIEDIANSDEFKELAKEEGRKDLEKNLKEEKENFTLIQKGIPCEQELDGADCADDVCEKQPLIAHDADTVKDLKKLNESEDEEMSDLELAEKFYRALEEKHCKK